MAKIKKTIKKTWNFLVHDDSWASFLVDLIIIIVLAKFVIYPGIGLAMGTGYPIVAVVSSSMDHHNQDFDTWWEEKGSFYKDYNISKEEFQKFYLADGFKKGDVLVIKGAPKDKLKVGDIIVYHVHDRRAPIIHRIIKINNTSYTYSTKGDANNGQIYFENNIKYDQIEGKAIILIPKLGWVKVIFVELINKLI